MPFMVKDGFRLYYEDTGGPGPTVLFLHGAGGNHLSWWQQVPVFAEEYRCVTVDQRGFGQSPDVAGGPGPAALGADALALLDHLGIAQATPVERYAATRIPTLFVTSDEDGLIWPELSQKVHEHVPGSRFERVGAAGHSTYFERPDVFNREVGAFLKEHRP